MSNTGILELDYEELGEPAMKLHLAITAIFDLKPGDIGPCELGQVEELELILESLKGTLH